MTERGYEPMIDKAVIPIAGSGTRLRPVTHVVPKAMFPLVDARGRLRTVVHMILAEAVEAGADAAALIVSPGQREMIEPYLDAVADCEGEVGLPGRIEYILQPKPEGFGEAVLRARPFVGPDAPGFLLLLGDHVYLSDRGVAACGRQVIDAFATRPGAAMIGVQPVGPEQLSLVGVAAGVGVGERIYRCTDFVEKPDPDTARARLTTAELGPDRFLAHCGLYVLTPEIFDCLSELARADRAAGDEVQLADAQSMLLRRHREDYYLCRIAGRALDTGTPTGYAAAQWSLHEARRGSGR